MTGVAVLALAERIAKIEWSEPLKYQRSRVKLVVEFLRRSAVWSQHLQKEEWPFFDVAGQVDPSVRVDPELIRRVVNVPELEQPVIHDTCVWALHFAALSDSGVSALQFPDPFEPLVVMHERGGGIMLDGAGFIGVGEASVPIGAREDRAAIKPFPMEGFVT